MPDYQAAYRVRWQAGEVAQALWQETQGLRHWETLSLKPAPYDGRTIEKQTGGTGAPQLLTVRIEPVSEIGIEQHEVRLWRSSYESARAAMLSSERDAFDVWLDKARYSALFAIHRTHNQIRCISDAPVAQAALTIMEFVEVPTIRSSMD